MMENLLCRLSLWLLAFWLPSVAEAARPPSLHEEGTQDQTVQTQPEDASDAHDDVGSASFLEHFGQRDVEAVARGLLSVHLSPKEAAMKSLERECVLQKAELFGRVYEKFGGTWDDKDQTKLVEDVIALQEFEEQRDNTWESFSKKKKAWRFVYKGKKLSTIADQIKEVNKNISSAGFNYEAVRKRCKQLEDEDTYACMQEKHPEVTDAIRDYVDAEDMLSHQKHMLSACSIECKNAKRMKGTSRTLLKRSSVDVKKLKKECKVEIEKKTEDFMLYVSEQLRSTKEVGLRRCIEDPEKGYCPEGTAPRASREFDPAKGAKWFAIGYVGSYGGGWLVLAVGLAIIAAPGGPAAMLAGFGLGSMLAQMIPSTAIGTSLFAWNSIGPRECACFPRDCVMEEAGCMLQPGSEVSSNPFGQALPYLSMKCVEVEKGKCSLQACETNDYQEEHASTSGIFGRVGTIQLPGKAPGSYNCLASEPKAGKALAMQQILPNGKNNTAISRAELFKLLQVKEKADPPSDKPPTT